MSIRQREGIWWIDLRSPSGKRIRQSTGTRHEKAAQEYHDRVKAELWRFERLGEKLERTFDEAALRLLQEATGQKDYSTKVRHVAYWRKALGGSTAVSSLTTEAIFDALPTHIDFKVRGKTALSMATKNRYLSTIRRLLTLCVEWKWIDSAPKLRPLEEPAVRVRWISRQQANALLTAINRDWMRDACAFALATGMRAGEILSLEFAQVNMVRQLAWVTAGKAKSKKARAVPLNSEAMQVIERRKGSHGHLVFTRNGAQQRQIDPKMFARACAKADIKDLHFHDLRHTWASWHVQAGTPLFVLKELGGWETLEMVKKYAHLDPGHLAAHANAVTFWAQSEPERETPPARVALSA